MNEQTIFTEALAISDVRQRSDFIRRACGSDSELRERVEALLIEHERSGEFLNVPALEQMKATYLVKDAPTDGEPARGPGSAETTFPFLQPSDVVGSMGRLGHYEIQELLGRGGCGIVFKAFDDRLHRTVAIKVMKPELATTSPARKMFLREARATASIRHENVVGIHAVEDSPIPFLVMEYIDGKSLQEIHEETGPFEVETVLRYGRMIARGLAAAHERGLIHRDIKPGNILIESGTEQVKITDFGLARAADDASQTQSGIAGTPSYMSPEQALGRKLDSRSDLFSLGSVLYVMCSGRLPFRAPKPIAVMNRIIDERPRDIREIIPDTPPWLTGIVRKLHQKNPAKRFQSAHEVAELLEHYEGQLKQLAFASPGSSPSPIQAILPKQPAFWGILLVLILVSSMGATEATGITHVRHTVIRLFYPEGSLVIDVGDPSVRIAVDGKDMSISAAGLQELRLRPGQYEVVATKEGKLLRRELVTIERNGREVVRVSREAPAESLPEISEEIPMNLPDRRAAEYVLSIEGEVQINDDSTYGESELISTLADLPDKPFRLTHVYLHNNPRVTDSGLAAFEGTQNLRALLIDRSPNYSDEGLRFFRENKGLKFITIGHSKITGSCFQYFTECAELRDLRFSHAPVTHENLKILGSFAGLNSIGCLMCEHTCVDDNVAADLKKAAGINFITFEGTEITDAGLKHLESLHELHTLVLGPKVTKAGFQKLARALPQTEIHWSGQVAKRIAAWTPAVEQQEFFDSLTKLSAPVQVKAVAEKLKELNPGFDGQVQEEIRDGQVVKLSFRADMVSEIWPVRALSSLTELITDAAHLSHSKLEDVSCLAGMPLKILNLSNSSVSDLSALRGMPLTHLYCAHTKIADLSPLADLRSLRVVFFWNNPGITDISPLADLPLTFVCFDVCPVEDLSPLQGKKLTRLEIYGTPVTDLDVIRGMPLDYLSCAFTRITDLSPIADTPLKEFHGPGLDFSDLSPFRKLPLTRFDARNWSNLEDLSPLAECPLNYVDVSGCNVKDLSPLSQVPLTVLRCDRTPVSDLTPLQATKLEVLSILQTRIQDLSPLTSMPLIELNYDLQFDDPVNESLVKALPLKTINSKPVAEFWTQRTARREDLSQFSESIASLAPPGQFVALRQKFDEYNGEKKVYMGYSEADGKVGALSLELVNEPLDLTPLIAFRSLEKLTLIGGPEYLDLSPLVSLPIKELTCRAELAANCRETIRRMKTLNTLNGEPIEQFSGE